MTTFRTILAEIADPTAGADGMPNYRNVYALASLAECTSPDSVDSPGAVFLERIARDVADHVGRYGDSATEYATALDTLTDGDAAHEIADSAVPTYTHERWQTFVDLGAYNEDPTEIGDGDASDLTGLAGVTLYLIAGRLVAALAEELREALDYEHRQAETAEEFDAAVRDEDSDDEPCDECEHSDCSLDRDVSNGLRPSVGAPLYDEAGEAPRS